MAFAIFYNPADLTELMSGLTRADLPQGERALCNAFWNSGVSTWQTAPVAADEWRCVDTPLGQRCDDVRMIVVSGKFQGKDLTLQQFRDLLYRLTAPLNAPILSALADDMAGRSGAVEPWPEA